MERIAVDAVAGRAGSINNSFYEDLGERWYEAWDDPIALLRAEGRLRNPWVGERIAAAFPRGGRVLDLGCGAGFLANALSLAGFQSLGVDLSRGSLKVARGRDASGRAAYQVADAYALPFRNGAPAPGGFAAEAGFAAVAALDFLEHVDRPERVVAEAARVLNPGGLFFFHTFNRNFLAWLIVIKGLEWFVRNTPPRMHVLPLFIKPAELAGFCRAHGMEVLEMIGMRPVVNGAFWKMLRTRRVPPEFRFRFTPSLAISYLGVARKAG